jgi:hypothetical protein
VSPDFLARLRKLSTLPTARHPFGLRHAVLERAAILHYEAGLPLAEADAQAFALEVDGGQLAIGGGL